MCRPPGQCLKPKRPRAGIKVEHPRSAQPTPHRFDCRKDRFPHSIGCGPDVLAARHGQPPAPRRAGHDPSHRLAASVRAAKALASSAIASLLCLIDEAGALGIEQLGDGRGQLRVPLEIGIVIDELGRLDPGLRDEVLVA